jgi:regulator of protease activity HflC (stomatin/prohibitin superfamily)
MNAINAAEREKVANENKGEAAKILTVKNAEAEAEKKHQSGLGVKMQRIAIAEGVKEAAALVKEAMPDLTDDQISEILFTNQYIDAITELTKSPNVKVMAFPLDPRAAGDIRSQFRDALIAARELPTDREITELAARTLEQKEGELKPSKEKIRK